MIFFWGGGTDPPPHPTTSATRPPPSEILNTPLFRIMLFERQTTARTGIVLLDLSSAFDTVDHETLLNVLNHRLLIDEPPLKWLRSYLTARMQVFSVDGAESASLPVDCSVPPGSVLGLIQFISYTDDVTVIFDTHKMRYHLFADDKQLYSSVTVY